MCVCVWLWEVCGWVGGAVVSVGGCGCAWGGFRVPVLSLERNRLTGENWS